MSTHTPPREHALFKVARDLVDSAREAAHNLDVVMFSRRNRPSHPSADIRRARDGERVRVYEDGKPIAAIIPISDLELLEALEMDRDVRDYDAAKADSEPRLSSADLRSQLGI
jgi:prevent-host-death family protein